MTTYPDDFLQQVAEGWSAPFAGWDFSWLADKQVEGQPPWDYPTLARQHMQSARAMLDMDTGGGELLASLAPFPQRTCATESYPPNIALARARLEPLGIELYVPDPDENLPIEDGSFDLVINRHGGYRTAEVHRVLRPGGIFLTQQVGGQNQFRLNELLQEQPSFVYADWTLDRACDQLRQAGLEILHTQEAFPEVRYLNIAAVVYYLRVISWQVEGFAPQNSLAQLYTIHQLIQREGSLLTHYHRFLIEARRPV
jgi:SAM-dependent methyltransferase